MLGELNKDEIETVLRSQMIGRIGCHAEGRTYVVPITYAYDGECIYGHSADGLKIRTMRANPEVCFEVEHIAEMAHWRSVVAWGRFEELAGPDEERAMKLLKLRFASHHTSETALPPHGFGNVAKRRAIYFRIRPTEKSGRYEKH